jgi:CRISPR system Cascade subunit CasA
MSFNLTQERWIPVVSNDWQRQEVSLIELFNNLDKYREIQADNPPTTLALHRFLIAILHRAYNGPRDEDHWEEIRDDRGQKAIDYLKQHFDKFDLLHPEYPFMQDLSISSQMAEKCYSYLAYEMHGENTSTVFCHQHHWSILPLSLSELARLVLRIQICDFHGRKMGATERAGSIPMVGAVNCLVWGKTVREILMRNLMQYNLTSPSTINGEDLPVWERKVEKAGQKIPNGYIDYLTYQWRKIRIFCNDNNSIKVVSHPGNQLPKMISEKTYECAIPYRKVKDGFYPVKLDRKRSIWRDSSVLTQSAVDDSTNSPRIMGWISDLYIHDESIVPEIIDIKILGLSVENAKPWIWAEEKLSIPIAYFKNRELWQRLKKAIEIAEEHQQVFKSFKGSPYHALAETLKNGEAGKLAGTLNGETRYWATLDREFQILLTKLPEDKTTNEQGTIYGINELPSWTKTVQQAARLAFTDSIESIRNYEARAKALQALGWKLADLRLTPVEREERKAKAKAKKAKNKQKEKVST